MKKYLLITLLLLMLAGCETSASITLNPGLDIIEAGSQWEDSGCFVTVDNQEVTMNKVTDDIDSNTPGIYTVYYGISVEGKNYSCTRHVTIIDTTSPTITLLPGKDTLYVGETWVDADIQYTDNADGTLTKTVDTSALDTTQAGTYQIIYSVTDSSGNIAERIRVVTVVEVE